MTQVGNEKVISMGSKTGHDQRAGMSQNQQPAWKETFWLILKKRIKAKGRSTWEKSNMENSPGGSDQVESLGKAPLAQDPAQGYPSEPLPSANREKLIPKPPSDCRELFCETVVESWDTQINPAIKA